MGTTNIQLIEIMKNFDVSSFKGVYSKDTLHTIEPNSGYIINLEDLYDKDGNLNSGTHWTAFVTDFNNRAVYFDSFGYEMPKSITRLFNQYKYEYTYNKKQIQNKATDLCGYFCCAFIYFLKRHPKRTKNIYTDTGIYLGLFENLRKVKSYKNELILSMFFEGKNKKILEHNNNVFKRRLNKDFKIENVKLFH